jgi:2-dehydro-3-deoxyglucarate aldolase
MMNRLKAIRDIRSSLTSNTASVGSWIQIPNASVAEIMGQGGYDWVAIDLEHGAISVDKLPDLFRALELGGTLPLARLAQGHPKDCKQALDAGAGGVIVQMIESAMQLANVRDVCRWPPSGTRGVGYSRANLFGKNFDEYRKEAQEPLLIAMVENIRAVENLDSICSVDGLDAILIGPYDLSASMGLTAEFESPTFISTIESIFKCCQRNGIASGIHVVEPDFGVLQKRIKEGYQFIAYSIDAVFLRNGSFISDRIK